MEREKMGGASLDALLREWQEAPRRLGAFLEAQEGALKPVLEARDALERSLQPIRLAQEQAKHLETLVRSIHAPRFELPDAMGQAVAFGQEQAERLETLVRSIQAPRLELSEAMVQAAAFGQEQAERLETLVRSIQAPRLEFSEAMVQAAAFGESIERAVSDAFEPFQRMLRELPPRTQEALLLLGSHGWYLDLEMPMPGLWVLRDALAEGDVTGAEAALCQHFEGRLAEIEESIATRFPRRAHLVRAAFRAHRRGEYDLSIPLLLAQADGIGKEVTDQSMFMRRKRKPRTAIYVERMAADSYMAALLSPLARTLPISASVGEPSGGLDALNRHAVLHGESLDYGSKTNGLKAVSLINYIAHVVPDSMRETTAD